jgi:pimeloyl-ACP methyl ester carboxylesterase
MRRAFLTGLLVLICLAAIVGTGGYFALRRPDVPYESLKRTYANAQSRYADLPGGVRMHFRDQGSRTGPLLLLVHGYSASLHAWEPWAQRLADRYRIVTIDLPGHGLTSAPADYQASIERYVRDVEAFAQSRNLPRFTLVGSSMGGHVAWEYALAHSQQLDGLVLVDAGGWPDSGGSNPPLVFLLLRNPLVRPLLRDLDNTSLVRQGLEAAFVDRRLVDDAMVQRYARFARAPGHREILIQMANVGDRKPATRERLAQIRTPTLIMHGDRDNLVPVEHGRMFAASIPGSELITWPDEGHLPMEEHPDRSAQALSDFLTRTLSVRAPPPAQPSVTQTR